MNGDNGQYEYDELRWLARDTHRSRRRAVWWTAGLTAGAMTLATVYVQRDPSNPAAAPGQTGGPSGTSIVREVSLDLAPVVLTLNSINGTLESIDGRLKNLPMVVNVLTDPSPSQANVIWLVEGTRRFPMAVDDVLWIPEAGTWLRVAIIGTEGTTQHQNPNTRMVTQVNRWTGDPRPPSPLPPPVGLSPLLLPLLTPVGNSNCVEVTSLRPSVRPGFAGGGYVDIETRFFTADQGACPPPPI